MTEIQGTTPIEDMLSAIQPNLIPVEQIEEVGEISAPDLTRAMGAMSGILVLTSVIDVKLLPDIFRPMVDDLREGAITGLALASELITARSDGALDKFLTQYVDVVESTESVLNSINQRLAYRFGRMAECKI